MTLNQGNLFIESNTNNKQKCSFNNVIETLDNMNKIKITVNYSEQKPNMREKENKYNKALAKYSNYNLQSNEEMLKQYPRTKVFDKYIINQETRDIAFVDNKVKKHKVKDLVFAPSETLLLSELEYNMIPNGKPLTKEELKKQVERINEEERKIVDYGRDYSKEMEKYKPLQPIETQSNEIPTNIIPTNEQTMSDLQAKMKTMIPMNNKVKLENNTSPIGQLNKLMEDKEFNTNEPTSLVASMEPSLEDSMEEPDPIIDSTNLGSNSSQSMMMENENNMVETLKNYSSDSFYYSSLGLGGILILIFLLNSFSKK